MQDAPDDFRSLIALWESPAHFARAVAGEAAADHGKIWKRRNRVPVEHHARVVAICGTFGIPGITLESLAAMRKRGRGMGY